MTGSTKDLFLVDCVNADRGAGQSLPAVQTEQVIGRKRQKTASREKSLEGRNTQEGQGQTRSQDRRWRTDVAEQTAEVPAKAEKQRSKGQERRELVTATDATDGQHPEGAKDTRGTGRRFTGRQRTLDGGNTLKP